MAESKILQKKNQIDIYQRVLSQRAQLRKNFGTGFCWPSSEDITNIIVILGSSRSGSSLLYHLLGKHPDLISLQGEEVTFERLFGLNEIDSFNDSDECSRTEGIDLNALREEILFDSGFPTAESERLPLDRAQRILLQWPECHFDLDLLMNAVREKTWAEVIGKLEKNYPQIKLGSYDQHLENVHLAYSTIVEEPPFVIPASKTFSKKKRGCTLLLKSSINAFRADLLTSLFPEATFQYIHLTRHPAGAINGLIDGWLSPAFHTHNVSHLTTLSIKGYENKEWWKFDLPPGWKNFTQAPLENVCAYQWAKANESIVAFLNDKKSIRVTYEELSDDETMKDTLMRIIRELSLSTEFLKEFQPPEKVMSVIPPRKDRWKTRADVILPLIRTADIKNLSNSLGYEV